MAGGLNRNITVRLLADTSNFTAGMAKVSGESQKTATTMEAAGGKSKLITTGIAAAGVAATALGVAAGWRRTSTPACRRCRPTPEPAQMR
jgi:hypothetical protein